MININGPRSRQKIDTYAHLGLAMSLQQICNEIVKFSVKFEIYTELTALMTRLRPEAANSARFASKISTTPTLQYQAKI